MALIGAVTAMLGAGIVVWGASALSSLRTSGRSESLLAPTLAVDTLDDDLRVVYMRTLVLDARCQARYGRDEAPRWGVAGRELRRVLVFEQANRTAGKEPTDADTFSDLVDDALDHVLTGAPLAGRWADLIETILSLRETGSIGRSQAAEKRSNSI